MNKSSDLQGIERCNANSMLLMLHLFRVFINQDADSPDSPTFTSPIRLISINSKYTPTQQATVRRPRQTIHTPALYPTTEPTTGITRISGAP